MKNIFISLLFIWGLNFNSQAQCNASFTYTLNNDQVTFNGYDSSFRLNNYWYLDKGDFSTITQGYNFSAKYDPGTYTVKHVVIDSINLCRDSVIQVIAVDYTFSCNASFTYRHDPLTNYQYSFYSNSTLNGIGGIASYLWILDGREVSNNSYLTDSLSPGKHLVCLNIVTASGCRSTACDTIEIFKAVKCNSQTSFKAVASSINAKEIQFSATPIISGMSYEWSFGDGYLSDVQGANHTYADTGMYAVRLYVYDSVIRNCIDTVDQFVIVNPSAVDSCTVSFSYVQNQNQVSFTAISNQTITAASWFINRLYNLNDSTLYFTSTAVNPVCTFTDTGYYNVCANLVTVSGCTRNYCGTIFIDNNSGYRQSNTIQSYPNPAANEVKLSVDIKTASPIFCTVYNNIGVPVYQKQQQGLSGANTITIPLPQLKRGQYFIDIQYGNERKQSVFQKL